MLKTELLPHGAYFAGLEEARLELAECLYHSYNTQRLHSAISGCTPLEIELHYLVNLPWFGVDLHPTTSVSARAAASYSR